AALWHGDERIALALETFFASVGVPAATVRAIPSRDDASIRDLLEDSRVAAVAFAGSHNQARAIVRLLAQRDGAIRPLIPFAVRRHEGGAPGCPLAGSPAYLSVPARAFGEHRHHGVGRKRLVVHHRLTGSGPIDATGTPCASTSPAHDPGLIHRPPVADATYPAVAH
ncbi:MAG: hypothetical protein WBM97_20810, partial [Sedimenticolaceae bacterium]